MAQCVRYRGQFGMQSLIKPSAAGLRQLPLQHVSLLGRGWEEDDLVHMLRILPDAVTSVCISGPFRAGLRLGQDSSGQVSASLLMLSDGGCVGCGRWAKGRLGEHRKPSGCARAP